MADFKDEMLFNEFNEMEEDIKELFKIFCTLRHYLGIYKGIKEGWLLSTPEILKNVQNSIKDLCTLITKETSN